MVAVGVQHAHVAVDRHADENDGALLGQGTPQQRLQHALTFVIPAAAIDRRRTIDCGCRFDFSEMNGVGWGRWFLFAAGVVSPSARFRL